MRDTKDILGVPFDNITMAQAVEKLKAFLEENKVHAVYTPNAEIVMEAKNNSELRSILRQADMLIADGAGVVLAAKILGKKLPEKVSGIDLTKNSFAIARENNIKYFFFGGKPGVAEEAAEKLKEKYPGIQIAGCRNGYFSPAEEQDIIHQINAANVDILLVALGAPKQEMWIHKNKDKLNVKVCIGVGGSLDIFAGKLKAAPEIMRRNGFEWLYRLYQEPFRYKRMLQLPKFVLLAIFVKLGIQRLEI